MKKRILYFALLIVCITVHLISGEKQTPSLQGIAYPSRMYNPNTVQTIKGEITNIQYVKQPSGRDDGVHLTVISRESQYEVRLGPRWFLEENNIEFFKGSEIEITGSKKTINQNLILIASKISYQNRTVILRDKYGIPMWSGKKGCWRRKK